MPARAAGPGSSTIADRWIDDVTRTRWDSASGRREPPRGARARPPLTIDPRLCCSTRPGRCSSAAPEPRPAAILKPIVSRGADGRLSRVRAAAGSIAVDRARVPRAPAPGVRRDRARHAARGAAARRGPRVLAHAPRPRARRAARTRSSAATTTVRLDARAATTSSRSSRATSTRSPRRWPPRRSARQQWIADIAHELRTPLAVLRARDRVAAGRRAAARPGQRSPRSRRRRRASRGSSRTCTRCRCPTSARSRTTRSRSTSPKSIDDGVDAQRRERSTAGRTARSTLDLEDDTRRARRRDAARAGVREPAAEHAALYRRAGPDLRSR